MTETNKTPAECHYFMDKETDPKERKNMAQQWKGQPKSTALFCFALFLFSP